jgi:hypothetical protein
MGKLIELVIRALPYPSQIRDIEIAANYVEFSWRGARYRVNEVFGVDEVGDGVLVGTDRAILMRACIDYVRIMDVSDDARRLA